MKKKKDRDFRFGFKHLIRLAIFALLLYYLFSYFSKEVPINEDPTILGTSTQDTPLPDFNKLYQSLPQDTRYQIEAIPSLPVIIKAQEELNKLKKESEGFPQKQINQLKKEIIRSVADDMIENID